MNIANLIETIRRSTQHCFLYHFTDVANFDLIKQHGLCPKNTMRSKGFWPTRPSGNQWSWDADDHKGISNYVSICLTRQHPMCYAAKTDERISDARYLCIEPDVLSWEGVLFANDIANKGSVELVPLADAIPTIDVEVLYSRTDWRDATVQSRLRAAEKYEILVPHVIPTELIPRAY